MNKFYRRIKKLNPHFRVIYAIWYRELLLFVRDQVKVFTFVFTPLFVFLIFGTGLKFIIAKNFLGYDFGHFFYPGLIAVSVAAMTLDSTMSIIWDREFGFLKEILVSPASRVDIALGKITGATSRALVGSLPLVIIAPFIGLPISFPQILVAILTILVLAWGMSSLGIIISSHIRRLETFNIIIQILIAPMIFLSGAFFPTHNASGWIKTVSNFIPLTYGVDALRYIFLESSLKARVLDIITTHNFLISILFLIFFAGFLSFFSIREFKKMR